MASAFEKVVRSVVRELDHKELTPVDSLWSSASFQPYSLLSRKPLHSRFWRPRYMCVNLSIRDILEPDAPEPVLECGGTFQFHDAMDGQLQGSVNLEAPGQGRLSGGATVSGSSSASMDLCTLRVAPNTWEAMHHERRLRQPEPKTLQQLRSRGHDVFVVTEVLQTQKEVEVTRTHKQEGLGQFALLGALCLQGKGEGHLSRKKMVTIPSGSTLAFRVAQLVIGSDWDILLFPDKKQRTFPSLQKGHRPSSSADGHPRPCFSFTSMRGFSYSSCQFQSDGSMEHWLATTDDFQGLQAEVKAWAVGLEGLSKGLCGQLLGGLGQVLRDEPALQALEESLEQGLSHPAHPQSSGRPHLEQVPVPPCSTPLPRMHPPGAGACPPCSPPVPRTHPPGAGACPALLTPTPPGTPTWSRCLSRPAHPQSPGRTHLEQVPVPPCSPPLPWAPPPGAGACPALLTPSLPGTPTWSRCLSRPAHP
ncbi:gasdermin-D isoform X5 [Ovis aries]|uniref:gasdermin-D isoform X5 n=1 Tax=Ovis aries TaxID=9940 RepID=UPI00295288A1|nr:gasdermin-D isoform X5 [Ovis aries]